jgi:hypothetical protein
VINEHFDSETQTKRARKCCVLFRKDGMSMAEITHGFFELQDGV